MGSIIARLQSTKKDPRFKVLVVGLTNAGKVTLMQRLSPNTPITPLELYTETTELILDDVRFVGWHLGCSIKIFPHQNYHLDADAIIFVLDSSETPDFTGVATFELHRFLKSNFTKIIPLLIFSNKTDLPGASPIAQITHQLELENLDRERHVQPASFANNTGIDEGVAWLNSKLRQ